MKKILSLFLLLLLSASSVKAAADVYSGENNKFGLKDERGNVIVEAKYKKLISLGDNSYIALKGSKYGVVASNGEILVDFKYSHATRLLSKFVKLKNYKGFYLFDEYGNSVFEEPYDLIELLFGGMLLTYKDYKYGVSDFKGKILIDNVCDDIYMPKPNIMRVKYEGNWYEIEQVNAQTLSLPDDVKNLKETPDFKITKLVTSPVAASKYSLITATDYSIKVFSSISPAYEATIDELMLSQGAEAVSIFIKIGWLPKFPFVYFKNYFKILRNPSNGPLSDIKENIKQDL